uniref:Uncharacterized protein n=1 Tax=Sinocyclocheilus anshuiensis TaxID=1608454 RepID=A0A671PVF6_9TELE
MYRGAMKVYQSVLLLFNCQFLHTLAFDCTVTSGNLKQIDAGSGSVVGVNNLNEAFVLIDNVFTKISMSLNHFSVGPAGQLGVNSANNIFGRCKYVCTCLFVHSFDLKLCTDHCMTPKYQRAI